LQLLRVYEVKHNGKNCNGLEKEINEIVIPEELRLKAKKNISNEMWEKYKDHLVDVVKLQDVLTSLPIDIINEILLEHNISTKIEKN
jgi:hypothetical protein